jgi:predicted AlkP superfamily pyrophosphatase or phosphodiesterase
MTMKTLFLAAALLAAPAAAQAAPPPKPKLILAISVDQFSSEVFNRYRSSYRAGLATLSRGIAYPVAYHSHASTETCPGHSVILTGRFPAGTGIVANSWIDRTTGKSVYCVSVPGQSDPKARGPQNIRVTTLGDWIKAAEPGARSFAVSGKDRAAIAMAGKTADAVYWWNDGEGFGTSAFAGPATPAVTGPAAAFDAPLLSGWKTARPTLWPALPKRCAALRKPHRFGQLDVSGNVPPEAEIEAMKGDDYLDGRAFQAALRASPLFDSLTVDFATQLIAREKLGHGPATDVLAVSLSATDYVGHRFGNGGAEMCAQQAALDATIGRLIKAVEAQKVPFVVVLTADHGSTDAAERQHEHDGKASRLDGRGFVKRLNAAVKTELGLGAGDDPLIGDADQLYVRAGDDAALAERIRLAALAWIKQQPEVVAAFTQADIQAATVPAGTPPEMLTLPQRMRLSFDPERSGDILTVFAERTSFGMPTKPGDSVAGHGTPWNHDRQVPILFWWPGAPAASRDQPAQVVDIAPTLAAVAGIRPPVPVDGRCLDLGGNCPAQ